MFPKAISPQLLLFLINSQCILQLVLVLLLSNEEMNDNLEFQINWFFILERLFPEVTSKDNKIGEGPNSPEFLNTIANAAFLCASKLGHFLFEQHIAFISLALHP